MKNVRKVVSTLLLVCMLASLMAVSASADDLLTFDLADQAGVTIKKGESHTFHAHLADVSYKVFWEIDGNPISTSYGNLSWNINSADYSLGSHSITIVAEDPNTNEAEDSATAYFEITAPALKPESISFAQNYVELNYYGDWGPNAYTVYPSGCSQAVTWKSNNPAVAVVDGSTGIVHATGSGETEIIAISIEDSNVWGSFKVHVSVPAVAITLNTSYLDLTVGGANGTIGYQVQNGASQQQLTWRSSNNAIATVTDNYNGTATVTPLKSGTATITASTTDGSAISNECLVTVTDGTSRTVTVTPVNVDLVVGQSKTLTATVSDDGTYIEYWICQSPNASIQYNNNTCTVKAVSATTAPVKVIAIAHDGTQGYALVNVTKGEALDLMTSSVSVSKGQTTTITVMNPVAGETFSWSYSPVDLGLVASAQVKDNSYVLTAGDLDGAVTVTCTSNNDSSRTASVTIGLNGVDPYGIGSISPKSVSWARGNGDLSFQVSPAAYWTYLDNQYLNTKSTSLASYWNGTLTLKAAYLNTLSNGNHTLKVYTATDANNNPTGLVYATIYVSGNGVPGASATYGDNAHVKGAASNLYFNSANPVSQVIISGREIDPQYYSLSGDGKTLTLTSSFLNQLPYGSYTMQLNGTNGTTQTTNFRIVTANYAPSTGDETNIGLWVAIMLLSGAGAVALIPRKKTSED